VLPPALHVLQGTLVHLIPSSDRFLQMLILRFYDLIRRISMEWQITWSAQLFACHCLHSCPFHSWCWAVNYDELKRRRHLVSTLRGGPCVNHKNTDPSDASSILLGIGLHGDAWD
jgi:hypothetical protein